ncbi:MAG: PaaI family thioesterase [Desulfobacterales bacterium]|nr:PaaI family thioesterase [Desulfobacterales bacterium]
MSESAFQDYYPDELSHCYGCGKHNTHGHQLKSRWDGEQTVAHFTPEPYHTAVPGFVYGGLLASLIDCHGTGSAAAVFYKKLGRAMDSNPPLRFVTASLHVDYLAPTPMGVELELRGTIQETTEKKAIVEVIVKASGTITAKGKVVAVQIPDTMFTSKE